MEGRRIGTYEVVSKLGEGGMGVVYLARHTTLGRLAAVKILLPDLSNDRDVVTRFFNEARAATAIRHAGIVEVFDFGFLDDGLAYLIMEYLEGESLGARLRRGPLAIPAALAISRGIARALQAAHAKEIVHRDLKPDNVFLVPDEESRSGERVKLLDFGIAKLAFNAAEASHTRTGTIIGTPTYMAPEQCRGTGAIDLRVDLYALGCVIYEMLSGRPPFVADSPAEVLAHHMYFEPRRISALRSEVPPPLDQFVMWLLAKDPANRPPSAGDVVKAIDALAGAAGTQGSRAVIEADRAAPVPALSQGTPLPGTPTTLSGAASAVAPGPYPRGRRRTLMIGLGALALALIVITGVLAAQRAPAEPEVAEASPEISSASAAGAVGAPEPAPEAESRPAPQAEPKPTPAAAPEPRPAPQAEPKPTPAAAPEPRPAPQAEPKPTPAAAPEPTPALPAEPGLKSAPAPAPVPKPPSEPRPAPALAPAPSPAPGSAKRRPSSSRPDETRTQPQAPEDRGKQECARASFQPILDEPAPEKAKLEAALSRLRRCRESLGEEAFRSIQDRLIPKILNR